MTRGAADHSGSVGKASPGSGLLEVCDRSAPLRSAPCPGGPLQTELLRGERFRPMGRHANWILGRAELDGYEGHVPAESLRPAGPRPNHRVAARATLLYHEPEARSGAMAIAWLGSLLSISDRMDGPFVELTSGQWVASSHLEPLNHRAPDPSGVAERLRGAPYLYGGRTGARLDCSALVQLALQAAGIPAPRDSGPQYQSLGTPVPDGQPLLRNDLAFWEGHVGILLGGRALLHANAHHMAVAVEPFDDATKRLQERQVAWLGIRRIDGIGELGRAGRPKAG